MKKINTVDIVVIINQTKIVLIKRTKPPFMDKLVLPGGKIDESDKNDREACVREADEEINLKVDPDDLKFLTILDRESGDPRPFIGVSHVYLINIDDPQMIKKLAPKTDAKSIFIREIKDLKEDEIGFHHWDAIKLL